MARAKATSNSSTAKKQTAGKKGGATNKRAATKSRSRSSASSKRSSSSRSKRSGTSSSAKRASQSSNRTGGSRGAASRRGGGSSRAASHVLVDHDEIRRWAEERNAQPASVRGTGGGDDPGMIRLDFPGFSGADSLEHIDWEEWFRAFDDNKLALIVQDTTARGRRSNFNKLVARENAGKGNARAGRSSSTRASEAKSAPKKAGRGSTRAHRSESIRGRATSNRRAA